MSPNQWIEQNYANLRRAALNISSGDSLAEDLLSECLLIFLDKPNAQEIVNSGGATYYFIRILSNQWKSSTSPFHKQYRRSFSLEVDHEVADTPEQHNEELETAMMKELEDINWYSRKLFELHHLDEESISKISRETKIPRASITVEIKRVRTYLKERAQNLLKK